MKRFRNIFAALGLALALAAVVPASAQILPGNQQPNFQNLLDNGAFQIYQRGTANVSGITTSATYHADRWAGYSGTATSMTLANLTTGLPANFQSGEQVQRTGGQTGVLPVCLVQEIPAAAIAPLAGQPLVLSFWAETGSNFSAAGANLSAQVVTGTTADQGLATLISGWAGVATPINAAQPITSSWQRFAWTGQIASTTLEAAVQFCYTPVGTAGTNDYFRVTGVQLQQGNSPSNFESKPIALETVNAQRYFWEQQEVVSGVGAFATCEAVTTTSGRCVIPLPVTMRVAATAACTLGTMTVNIANTATALTACAATAGGSTPGTIELTTTVASGQTAGQAEVLASGNSTGGGIISASADF